jgi:hypothetical protein
LINETQKYEDKGVGFISNKDNADYKQLKWELNRFNDSKPNKFRNKKSNKSPKKSSDKKGPKNSNTKPVKSFKKQTGGKSKKNFRFNKK